tara:strand:+ start:7539 stop:7733 length:195 start_codon:yes stop_codon:yes gene_type:complete
MADSSYLMLFYFKDKLDKLNKIKKRKCKKKVTVNESLNERFSFFLYENNDSSSYSFRFSDIYKK